MSSSIASLVASIDKRLEQLTREIETLARSRAALQRDGANGARPAGRRSPRRAPERTTQKPRAAGSPVAARSEPSARRSAAGTRPAVQPHRPTRRPVAASAAGLERVLVEHPAGLSARAIGELAGAGYAATLGLLRTMEASGQVQCEGSRRSTVWRLVSDEERVAARAAELERLATAPSAPGQRRRGGRRASH